MPSEGNNNVLTQHVANDEDAQAVLKACEIGDAKTVGEFVITRGDLREINDRFGRNALHYCVQPSDEDQLQFDEKDGNKLKFLESRDRLKCARIIMKTTPELIYSLDSDGLSPLHLAVIHGDLDLVTTLIDFNPSLGIGTSAPQLDNSGTSSDYYSNQVGGRTAIHLAVIYEQIDVLRVLMRTNVGSAINQLDEQGATALHYSVQLPVPSVEEAINILIVDGSADIDCLDTHGRTPLSWSATIGATSALTLLLKLGAKLNVRDECGLAALHCAASRGHTDVVQFILKWIRTANMDDLTKMEAFRDVTDKDGCTPLFYSVTLGHQSVTRALLEAGAKMDVVDFKGRSLAHCLSRIPDANTEIGQEIIRGQFAELCRYGLNVWKPNFAGSTPLHEACLLRNRTLVNEMSKLDHFKQVVNQRDAQGHTPLHLVVAASWSSDPAGLDICSCLLDNNAELNASTLLPQGTGVTALDLAIMNEQEEAVSEGEMRKLLERKGAKLFREIIRNQAEDGKKMIQNKRNKRKKRNVNTSARQLETDLVVSDKSTNTSPVRSCHSCHIVSSSSAHYQKPSTRSTQTSGVRRTNKSTPANEEFITAIVSNKDETANDKKHCSLKCRRVHDKTERTDGSISTSPTSVLATTPKSSGSVHKTNRTVSSKERSQSYNKLIQKHGVRASSVESKQKTTPYSHMQLERHLPAMIDRYIHDDMSKLYTREHLPRCTLSPYLIPLVPVFPGQRRANTNAKMIRPPQHKRAISASKGKPRIVGQDASNNNKDGRDEDKSVGQKHNDKHLNNETKAHVRETSGEEEYRSLLNHLAKIETEYTLKGAKPGQRKPKIQTPQKENTFDEPRLTALGSEITPRERRLL